MILAAFALRLLMNRYKHDLQDIPGPKLAKYTGLWKLHNVWKGDHHNTAIELHQKHGSLVRIGPRHVSVGDPSAIPVIYGLNKGFTKVCICPRVLLGTRIASPSLPTLKQVLESTANNCRPLSTLSSVYHGIKSLK